MLNITNISRAPQANATKLPLSETCRTKRRISRILSFPSYYMSNRYAPLPNPRSGLDSQHEMEAAFEDSDDEDDNLHDISESQPLNPNPVSPHNHQRQFSQPRVPGTYDFENVDYDYPPPGSPPAPSSIALPNSYGNSNGLVPSFDADSAPPPPRRSWLQRGLYSVLPAQYAERLGGGPRRPQGIVGGGTNNDGVFANVTAKPTRPIRVQDGISVVML